MSFMYPRIVAIYRQSAPTAVGATTFGGDQPANETPIASNLPANIQLHRKGMEPSADLPAQGRGTEWRVFIPKNSLALGAVKKDDVVEDDIGTRYQVIGPYWNSLGYQLQCELLVP